MRFSRAAPIPIRLCGIPHRGSTYDKGIAVSGLAAKMPVAQKRVAILQSSYIPWKGYFDLMNSVDEFILYDDVQYTKRDWRSRNQIKTANGLKWLSIPIEVKSKFHQRVRDARVSDRRWGQSHWGAILAAYREAPYFKTYKDIFEPLYLNQTSEELSQINHAFLSAICRVLGITTTLRFSMEYDFQPAGKNEQLIHLCRQAGATEYISGPAAKDYMSVSEFEAQGLSVRFFDYSGYPEYQQKYPPFEHAVSVLDLLFNEGPNAHRFMKSF